ncbi:MAG: tetratricopeptide repeat protein [Planctomycetes bacterium]|nr:tetratricopeptide repeat protein [Planctomycetota bacterium]
MTEYDDFTFDFIEPVTASECLSKAVEFLERGQFDFALKYVDDAIEKGYFGVDVYLIRAQILLELNRPEEASIDIETALEQEPYNSEFIIWKSRTLMLMNKIDESLNLLDELISVDPLNSEAKLTKALIFYSESRLDDAETEFLEIYDNGSGLPEQSAVSAYWLAKIKQLESKIDEAFEYFEISIGLAPFYSYVYSDYAELLRQENKLEQSEEIFQQGLDLFPENAALANDYANLLREMNKNEDSIYYLLIATKNDPSLMQAFYNLGLSYQKINKHEQAQDCFEKVVEDNPDDAEAKIRLAESLLHLKNLKRAYLLVSQVIETEPDNAEFLLVFIDVADAYLIELENTQDWSKVIEVYITMFNASIDTFKPKYSTSQNSNVMDRLLKVFRQLEVYNVEKHPESQFLQLHINIIRFHHALLIYEYIVDKRDLNSNHYEMKDEIHEYLSANIGVLREISSRFENESDSIAYFGYYLQALYHWRVTDSYIDVESNIVKALNLCENNHAALFNVKAQFYKSKFRFREAIHEYFMIIKQDKSAYWIYQEISKLYVGLRNFDAAKYYHSKFIQGIKEYPLSKREKATNFLDSAALWVAIGNYEKGNAELRKCNKHKAFLGNRSRKRLQLLEIFVLLEVNEKHHNIE